MIRQDLRFVNRTYNLYNYTIRAVQLKQKIFHKLVDKRNGCRFIIYNIRAKIFVWGGGDILTNELPWRRVHGERTKRRKVSAKLHTVHNASVCKQPPNANRSVGFSPINCPIQQKQHIILMRFFVGGDNRARQQRSGNACISKRACSVTGAQGRTECAKAEKPPYPSPQIVSRHIKKAQHIMLRVF